MQKRRIVVVGGSAAGPNAAAKARRMDQHAEITIIQKETDFSMAACGYPYYVGGTFDDRNQLICTPTGVIRHNRPVCSPTPSPPMPPGRSRSSSNRVNPCR